MFITAYSNLRVLRTNTTSLPGLWRLGTMEGVCGVETMNPQKTAVWGKRFLQLKRSFCERHQVREHRDGWNVPCWPCTASRRISSACPSGRLWWSDCVVFRGRSGPRRHRKSENKPTEKKKPNDHNLRCTFITRKNKTLVESFFQFYSKPKHSKTQRLIEKRKVKNIKAAAFILEGLKTTKMNFNVNQRYIHNLKWLHGSPTWRNCKYSSATPEALVIAAPQVFVLLTLDLCGIFTVYVYRE